MNLNIAKIALGGGCHWCTEAVFRSLKGVKKVKQGFVASSGENDTLSEAVIVHFNEELITLKDLIEIHLNTHQSTVYHSMRSKYRSAVYTFSKEQALNVELILTELQCQFDQKLITQVLPFVSFKASEIEFTDYYYKNPQRPFCKNYISPKLQLLQEKFEVFLDTKLENQIPAR